MENAPILQNLRKKSKSGRAEGIFFTFPDPTALFRMAGKCSKMVGSSRFKGLNATNCPNFHIKDTLLYGKCTSFSNSLNEVKPGSCGRHFFTFPDLTAHFSLTGKCSKMIGSSRFKGLYATNGPNFHTRGPGPRAWGARGPTLRAAQQPTNCTISHKVCLPYILLASVPREAWGPLHLKPWALAP